jgi:hypothetical protein
MGRVAISFVTQGISSAVTWKVVSMVEGMQRSTSMLSVTGYLTLALAAPSNGILPDMSFQVTLALGELGELWDMDIFIRDNYNKPSPMFIVGYNPIRDEVFFFPQMVGWMGWFLIAFITLVIFVFP